MLIVENALPKSKLSTNYCSQVFNLIFQYLEIMKSSNSIQNLNYWSLIPDIDKQCFSHVDLRRSQVHIKTSTRVRQSVSGAQ